MILGDIEAAKRFAQTLGAAFKASTEFPEPGDARTRFLSGHVWPSVSVNNPRRSARAGISLSIRETDEGDVELVTKVWTPITGVYACADYAQGDKWIDANITITTDDNSLEEGDAMIVRDLLRTLYEATT